VKPTKLTDFGVLSRVDYYSLLKYFINFP